MNNLVSAVALSMLASTANAVVLNEKDYRHNVAFSGLDATVFDTGGADFLLGGVLTGWQANVTASFSNSAYDVPYVLSGTNQSSATYSNSSFPAAEGIFFGGLAPEFDNKLIRVSFDITFTNISSGRTALDLAVYSAESLDAEIDRVSHSNGVLDLYSSSNLTAALGDGTDSMFFSAKNEPGNGEYILTTMVRDGDTITWDYRYRAGQQGSNMIAFSAYSVPLPGGGALLVPALAGLAWAGRRRKRMSHR